MTWISVVFEGPYRKDLLKPIWTISSKSGAILKASWERGLPIHAVYLDGEDIADDVERVKALVALADANDVSLVFLWSDKPIDKPNSTDSVTREHAFEILRDALPFPGEGEDPTASDIAGRALCLTVMHLHGSGRRERAAALVAEYGIEATLSPSERAYLADGSPGEMQDNAAVWAIEGAYVMLAALGALSLGPVTDTADVSAMVKVVSGVTASSLAEKAVDGALYDVLDSLHEIEEMNWRLRDARLNGRPDPVDFDPGVVIERHCALAWLATNVPWDDVDTST